MNIQVEGQQSSMPDQGKDKNYIRDGLMEVYRYSRESHERNWCSDHFVYYKHFKNYVDSMIDPDDYHSNIGVGLAFPIVKIISSTLTAPWQAGDEIVSAEALDEASRGCAPRVEAYVNNMIVNRVPRMFSILELVKESGVALGRGILKPCVRWDPPMTLLKRAVLTLGQQFMPGGVNLGSVLQYQDVPAAKRFGFEYVDPFNFWWTGSSRWVEHCDVTFERTHLTTAECHRRFASGEWGPVEDFEAGSALGYDTYSAKRVDLEAGGGLDNVHASDGQNPKMHRYIEAQGWVETKKKKGGHPVYEQMLVGILDEKWMVRSCKLDTWNGKPGYIIWEPMHDFAGDRPTGVIEPMESVLLVLNDFVNIALDNSRKAMESSLLVDPTSTDQEELYLGPGELNFVRDPRNSVSPLPMKDLPRSFYELIGYFNDLLQRISGVSDYFGGMNTADTERVTKTAKGLELMTSLATKRFAPLVKKMDLELYRPLATFIHETSKQRMKDEETVRVPGNPDSPFTLVGPSDMEAQLRFTFNVKALDMASGRRRQDFIEAISMISQIAQTPQFEMQGNQLDTYELARLVMSEFDREKDAEKIIKRVMAGPMGMPMVPSGVGPEATPGQPSLPGRPRIPSQIRGAA